MVRSECKHVLRTGKCTLDAGHKGRHSSVTWICDACGKKRRGSVYAYSRDGEYENGLAFCFMCAGPLRGAQQEWFTNPHYTNERLER